MVMVEIFFQAVGQHSVSDWNKKRDRQKGWWLERQRDLMQTGKPQGDGSRICRLQHTLVGQGKGLN